MSEKPFQQITVEIETIKNDISGLKKVESKIDSINSLLEEVKSCVLISNDKIKDQQRILDEIRVSADFRKRESENSIREIKGQMHDMENQISDKTVVVLDRLMERLDKIEKTQKEETSKIVSHFNSEISSIRHRVESLEKWKLGVFFGFFFIFALMISIL